MEKILKQLHWFIIAYAGFNLYMLVGEKQEQLTAIKNTEDIQKSELIKNKKNQKEISTFYKNIDEEKLKIEKVAQEIERMQQVLPSEVSDIENIQLVRDLADDVNIKEISINPGRETDNGFYLIRDYKVVAKATYLQFLILFEKISENKRILNIGETSFKKLQAIQRGRFEPITGDFSIRAYRYNSKFKEDRGIDEIEKKFQETKSKAPSKRPISKKSLGDE
ncbi:MAG: type 4a pilus biogenesis protein PilO [Bdellovibrionales bacterium]|nr:type 4a pilus biogenesis protein PilO [Bdellovibrionales bacterium]